MRYDDYVKRIVSKMLGAKSNKYKFMDIQKKLLDIIYIIILSKNIYKKKCYLSIERICSLKKKLEEKELEEVQEPPIDIQIELKHEAIILDV